MVGACQHVSEKHGGKCSREEAAARKHNANCYSVLLLFCPQNVSFRRDRPAGEIVFEKAPERLLIEIDRDVLLAYWGNADVGFDNVRRFHQVGSVFFI